MTLNRTLACGALALTVAILATTRSRAASAPAGQENTNFTLEGKITDSSPGKLTLSTSDNIIFTVRYDDKTEIKRADGSPGSSKDLRLGVTVNVEGDLTESGDVMAHKIEVEQPPKEQPSHP